MAHAVWPEVFRDPPGPDVAFTAPGNTTERLEELVARAEANSPLFPPASRDLDLLDRLGARLRGMDSRKHFEIVVETDAGPKKAER